jgi:cyclopropane-fatty-acyl-phospholipid synthase
MDAIRLAERRLLPDWLIRFGIRRLLRKRLRSEGLSQVADEPPSPEPFVQRLRQSPVTVNTTEANKQHYEVPPGFFEQVLGSRLKYSCGYWRNGTTDLDESEEAMLDITCRRAEIEDGMEILDLGCGWGSASLWIAERYPRSRVLAVSNSASQRKYIMDRARNGGLGNIDVVTCDVAQFDTDRRFDRVVSIEMFEHVRNYELLMKNIAGWLRPSGKLFVHIFCHRRLAYAFETDGAANWMGRYFFTGGIMPSEDLLAYFQDDLILRKQWRVSGLHYAQTCEAWLRRSDQRRARVVEALSDGASPYPIEQQLQRWRMFFMACAELFGYGRGNEWFVSHYLFDRS